MDFDRAKEVLYSGRFDEITVKQARRLIESSADLSQKPLTKRFYFGCSNSGAGHYLFIKDEAGTMQRLRYNTDARLQTGIPWEKIDGYLMPSSRKEGVAALHHKEGWTAIAFADYSVDKRPGSNIAFFFNTRMSFDEALLEAKKTFPEIFGRLDYEVVPVS